MELKPDAQKHSVDVAIVGYGPVGATLANILGSRGVKVSVFDKEPSIYHQPVQVTSTVKRCACSSPLDWQKRWRRERP